MTLNFTIGQVVGRGRFRSHSEIMPVQDNLNSNRGLEQFCCMFTVYSLKFLESVLFQVPSVHCQMPAEFI